ncbi:chemotaxis protein CheW [Domibacillus sp. A3M-37]|uniref:chemotaxis protein CheW n=1 Tax=Domibacillus sp. A3M-37 TaxID=2962037 RepID=UPI0020B896A8|nr:chemotaxis protein CheW [Domibacillus sp. A3M-37]MCP3764741.1 chemotaxis protein CheW [Domibacillus sp. A3M-37]
MGIQNVVSIEKVTEPTNLPGTPEYMNGVVNIRGQLIPVIDMSTLLYNQPIQPSEDTRYILVETNGTIIAFMVEKASEIVHIDEDQVKPVNLLGINIGTFIKGVAVKENFNVTILDTEELLSSLADIDLIRAQIAEQNKEYILVN